MGQLWREHLFPSIGSIELSREASAAVGIVGTWRWEPQTGRADWSPETYLLHGLSPSLCDPNTTCWIASLLPEDRERCLAATRQLVDEERPFTLTFRVPGLGGVRWLVTHGHVERGEHGEVVGYAGTVADVTDLCARLESALADAAQLAELIGAHDREPDAAQRLSKRILATLNAAMQKIFMIGPLSGL